MIMLLYGATMFLSALLLFLVQPLIGKYILPWFGGTPSVWTTCMLFFQALLLGGYGYAHALASRWPPRRQALFHIGLLSASILVVLWLSILPSPAWKPAGGQFPVLRILGLLSASIGAPYLLLSSTSPLLQSWFSRARPGSSPYRLYALSNLGSLLAILGYPFLIEPALSLSRQAAIWSWTYIAFAVVCILLSLKMMKAGIPAAAGDNAAAPEVSGFCRLLSICSLSSSVFSMNGSIGARCSWEAWRLPLCGPASFSLAASLWLCVGKFSAIPSPFSCAAWSVMASWCG
jgi:hypothetical protein